VLDHEGGDLSCWAAIVPIAEKIGCVPQTLFKWIRKAEVDSGKRAGVPTEMADQRQGRAMITTPNFRGIAMAG
jgi:transposase